MADPGWGHFLGEVVGAGVLGSSFPAKCLIRALQGPWPLSTDGVFPSCPAPKHAPGSMREGLAQGRSTPAQIAKTGVLSERSKRKKKKAAGDLGQDPDETVTAGAPPAPVRWGSGGHCEGEGGGGGILVISRRVETLA